MGIFGIDWIFIKDVPNIYFKEINNKYLKTLFFINYNLKIKIKRRGKIKAKN